MDPPRPPMGSRVVRDSPRWFSEGAALKLGARRSKRCVECGTALPTRRTPYCSRKCQWRFAGRYFWDSARTYVIHRDRFTCRSCRTRFRVRHLEVDHIVEIARGGAALDYDNLQTLCRRCHSEKTRGFLRARASLRRSAALRPPPATADTDTVPDGVEWFPA